MKINENGIVRDVTEEEIELFNPDIPEEPNNSSGGVKSDEWQLLHQYKLEEDTSTIIDFDTFDFANKYKAIRIQFNGGCTVNSALIYFYYNNTSNLCNMGNCTSTNGCRYDWTFTNDKFYVTTAEFNVNTDLKRTVSTSGATTFNNQKANWIEKIEDITGIRMQVQGSGTFPAGMRVSIFGKEA